MKFNQDLFNTFIINQKIIQISDHPITLKSGKKSNVYINWRRVADDAFLMDQLTDFVLNFVAQHQLTVDTFYGVAEGATKLGILTQFKYAKANKITQGSHQLSMGRAKPKEHGAPEDRFFVGEPKGQICVLEDVTTTGGSLINCIKQLQTCGLTVCNAIGLTNRQPSSEQPSVKSTLANLGVPYYAMSSSKALIDILSASLDENDSIKKLIENFDI